MNTLAPAAHRMLDFGTVVLFAAAPLLFGLPGGAALLSYALAAVHLLMTLLTHFPGGGRGVVPYRLHVLVEVIVGCALIFVGAFIFPAARTFFWLTSALILVVVFLSYGSARTAE